EGFEHALHISHPVLPDWIHALALRQLRVGDASVDITFKRNDRGDIVVEHVDTKGHVDVTID
ncbi:MAG TPA: hypothetical protein VJ891_12385, partial [Casimicrobiaceae bacterium]|nr:hypothetical protein [Casimicrobiaceae bacterium]